MRQLSWKIFAFRQAIALSNCQATAKVNIRFGSTGNGVSALFGPIVDRMKSRLWTTTEDRWKMADILAPMHPGEVLDELYLRPLGMSAGALAKKLGVPRTRIERIVKNQTSITPDTAFRLAKAFKTTPLYWMNMQTSYDLALAGATVDVSDIQSLDAILR